MASHGDRSTSRTLPHGDIAFIGCWRRAGVGPPFPVRHNTSVSRRKRPERLRVVTLLDYPDISGGGERMAVTLAMRLDPARFESVLCATRSVGKPTFEDDLRAAGVTIMRLERRSRTDLAAWRPLFTYLRDGVHVLHAHKFGSNVWGTLLGRLARVPVVIAHEQSWASARSSTTGRSFAARSTAR